MLSKFVNHIEENIYNHELIYRSLLVVKSKTESHALKTILDNKDYTSHIVDNIDYNIDYNDIDCRILIISINKFKDFIEYIDSSIGISVSSYNFIGFYYSIEEEWVNNMIAFYRTITDEQCNNVIILQKNNLKKLSTKI